MLRNQWHCNPIMLWLGRELGWDLISEKNQNQLKKTQAHLFLSLQKIFILGFQVLKSFLGPVMGKTLD